MAQPRQMASAQTAVRTSSIARMSKSQRNAVLQRATSSHSKIGLKRWRVCCRGYVLLFFRSRPLPLSINMTCHPLIPRFRSSIPAQTLRQSLVLLSNVISGLGIPLPFLRGQRQQMLPLLSQKIPNAPFPLLLSPVLDLKLRNLNNLMKNRAVPLGILQFPRTCPVSHSQTSRDGTTVAPPCSL